MDQEAIVRAAWRVMLEGSKQEALLAVDLYNQSRQARRLEGFFVHTHLAWLYLLHAAFRKAGIDYRYRLADGRRFERVDGEPRTWELSRCLRERWPDANDPVRKNLELTIALRNKIEHRYQDAIGLATAGYAQALVLNYEAELVNEFGASQSLATELRFPIFVGTMTRDGAARLAEAARQVPASTRRFLADFHAALDPAIAADQRFEFRVHLVPRLGPRGDADAAMTFLREDELTPEQRDALVELGRTGNVVVREQLRPVSNADRLLPTPAARAIENRIPFRFRASSEFPRAWRALGCRPPYGDPHPERTDERYCTFDAAHRDYVYTQAFIDKVVRETSTRARFVAFLGREPVAKPTTAPPLTQQSA